MADQSYQQNGGGADQQQGFSAPMETSAPAGAAAPAPSNRPIAPEMAPGQRPRLHLSSLPPAWNNNSAQAFFARIGTVVDCVVFKDPQTGHSKYGFLEFETADAAIQAIEDWNDKEVEGARLQIKFAKPKGGASVPLTGVKAEEQSRLFVANIGTGATAAEVRAEFERFGPLVECSVWPNAKASPRSNGERALSAFVQFTNAAHARTARDAMHLKPLLRGQEVALAAAEGPDFRPTPPLIVDFARPKPGAEGGRFDNPRRGGGGGGGGDRGGYRGGNGAQSDDRYGDRYGGDRYGSSSSSRGGSNYVDARGSSGSSSRGYGDDYRRSSSDDYYRRSSSDDYYRSSSSSGRDDRREDPYRSSAARSSSGRDDYRSSSRRDDYEPRASAAASTSASSRRSRSRSPARTSSSSYYRERSRSRESRRR